jgi:hypothetical protein
MGPVVAPAAPRTGTRREDLVNLVIRQSRRPAGLIDVRAAPEPLIGRGALRGDVLGPAQLPGQGLSRVFPGQHPASRQMMQLHPPARPAHHTLGRERVQRQRQRRPRVVHGQHVPAGLVIHHHELARAARAAPFIQPVDPPGHRDQVGARRHRTFHPDRLAGRIQAGHVRLHQAPGPAAVPGGLCRVGKALVDPAALKQVAGGRDRSPLARQPPPPGQRVVHARAQAVVRPRRALAWRRPVQVAHPVPARAVQPGAQPGRRARVKPPGHALEAKLLHGPILTRPTDKPGARRLSVARGGRGHARRPGAAGRQGLTAAPETSSRRNPRRASWGRRSPRSRSAFPPWRP